MAAALVVRRRPVAPGRCRLEVDALDIAVERQIEVEASLLAIGDHVEPGAQLVAERGDDRVVLYLGDVVGTKRIQMCRGMLEPAREGIGTNNGRAQGLLFLLSVSIGLFPGQGCRTHNTCVVSELGQHDRHPLARRMAEQVFVNLLL